MVAEYMAHGPHKGVVLTVSASLLFIDFAQHLQLDYGGGLEAVGGADHIAQQLDILLGKIVTYDVAHNERKVVGRDGLLFVAQLYDTVGDTARLLWTQIQMHTLKILEDIGPAAVLAQGIFASAAETLRQQVVAIKIVFLVAVGVDARHLGEDIVTHNGAVGGNRCQRIAAHQTA